MSDFIHEKVIPKVMGFMNRSAMIALKDGLLLSMPMTIIGSVFLLLQQFPWMPVREFLENAGLYTIFGTVYANTFNIMALLASIGIANIYVKNKGYEGLPAGMISLSCSLMAQPQSLAVDETQVTGVIVRDWLAGKGMIAAILVGISVGVIYTWFMERNITIKMPAGVPQGVASAFTALIPAAVIVTCMTLLNYLAATLFHQTVLELIYSAIQSPLQGITDNLFGVFIYCFFVSFFWWFGIHGSTVMSGILGSLLIANYAENEEIYQKLILEDPQAVLTPDTPGVHLFTQQIISQFVIVTGSGLTFGLVIYMLFFAKSEQIRSIGTLSIGPAVFNINEPVLFGTPIVLNPMLFIPFVLTPTLSGCMTYLLTSWGILPIFRGITVPWTTPPLLSGLLIGGWKTMLWQLAVIVFSFFLYFPFIKAYDEQCYKEEIKRETELEEEQEEQAAQPTLAADAM